MKKVYLLFIAVFVLLLIDQAIKIWIKTHFYIGEEYRVFGLNWWRIFFIENDGMAYGLKWGGKAGKLFLTLFRLVACIWGTYYLYKLYTNSKKKAHTFLIISIVLILAGAMGNLIDSMFYGLIFNESSAYTLNVSKMFPPEGGYGHFMFGNVVDMFYFPFIQAHWPEWVPFLGGRYFEFFQPIFNFADVCVTVGAVIFLFGHNRFFKKNATSSSSAPV